MAWGCFTGDRLVSLIACNKRSIGVDEYEDIIYNGLFSLVDDLLKPPEQPKIFQIADEITFLFM